MTNCRFEIGGRKDTCSISGISQWISMTEVSKYAEINCSSFDNLGFSLEDVNIETFVLKATVWKFLLSSLVAWKQ